MRTREKSKAQLLRELAQAIKLLNNYITRNRQLEDGHQAKMEQIRESERAIAALQEQRDVALKEMDVARSKCIELEADAAALHAALADTEAALESQRAYNKRMREDQTTQIEQMTKRVDQHRAKFHTSQDLLFQQMKLAGIAATLITEGDSPIE